MRESRELELLEEKETRAARPGQKKKKKKKKNMLTFEYGASGSSGSTSSERMWRSASITACLSSSSTMPRLRPHSAPAAARRAHAIAPSTSADAELRVARLVEGDVAADAAAASSSAAAATPLRFLGCSGDPGAEPGGASDSDPTMAASASAGEVFAGMLRRGVVLEGGLFAPGVASLPFRLAVVLWRQAQAQHVPLA